LDGPPGPVTHLAVDGREPDRLWAVVVAQTIRGGDRSQWARRGQLRRGQAVYVTTDGGETWIPAGNGLPYGEISALAYDSFSDQLYIGLVGGGEPQTGSQGLFRSHDGGATWQWVRLVPSSRQLKVQFVGRSADESALYVGAIETTKYPRSFVYRSDDNGSSWREIEALQYDQASGSILTGLLPDPYDSERLYLTTYGGLFLSEDGGQEWQNVPLPGCPVGLKLLAWEPVGVGARRLYLACSEGTGGASSTLVLRSDDRGSTWQALGEQGPIGGARSLAFLPGEQAALLMATDRGLFRSQDAGVSWTHLRDAREPVGASALLALPDGNSTLFAATGHGLYASIDGGDHWAGRGAGLPPSGRVRALATSVQDPQLVLVGLQWDSFDGGLWLASVLRSEDGGNRWRSLITGPWGKVSDLYISPHNANHLFVSTSTGLLVSRDGGASWTELSLDDYPIETVVADPWSTETLYAGLYAGGVYRSLDGGLTWEPQGLPSLTVRDLIVDQQGSVYSAVDGYTEGQGGVYRSTDRGATWERLTTAARGLETSGVRRLLLVTDDPEALYITVEGLGVYASEDGGESWLPARTGMPAGSDILVLTRTSDGTLWAARDGGGVYRSVDQGKLWTNSGAALGENLVLSLVEVHSEELSLLAATDNAGIWVLPAGGPGSLPPAPAEVDARVEIVWPHGGRPVEEAERANIGLRLFYPDSLVPVPCGWTPTVSVWQAEGTEPARPLGRAEQRSVEGRPFPYWELNDVDVSVARDPQTKLYFMVQVQGIETASGVWAHGADPRTYFPLQDAPVSVSTREPMAVDARIQIVWPHDGLGREQPVQLGDWANVSVALFEPRSERSVPATWEPEGLVLYGAWNQSIGQPLAVDAEKRLVRRDGITYPVWDFNNIDVRAARDPMNKLYLWVDVEGVTTYPTIWAHGADARSRFPAEDEPVTGCGVPAPHPPAWSPQAVPVEQISYVGDAAAVLSEALAGVTPEIPDASSGVARVIGPPAEALRGILTSSSRGLVYQQQEAQGQEYMFVADGPGPVVAAALGERVALFWPEFGEIWRQWWAGPSDVWDALSGMPHSLRVVRGDRGLEMGIASDVLDDQSWANYHLLRLYPGEQQGSSIIAGHWEPLWSWQLAPPASWNGLNGRVEFASSGLNRLRLTGPLPTSFADAPRVFAEVGGYAQQQVSSIWERLGDDYVRGEVSLQRTPLTTLSRFIVALREGDLDTAALWVSEQSLVEDALALGWSLPRPEGDRLLATEVQPELPSGPIEFRSEDDRSHRFLVRFEWKSGDWRIGGIERQAEG
jgi:photosystem II stability/assembly factor-like uncharacterized protein